MTSSGVEGFSGCFRCGHPVCVAHDRGCRVESLNIWRAVFPCCDIDEVMPGDPEPEREDIGDDHEYSWEDLHRDRDHEPPPVIAVSDEGMSPLSDQPRLPESSETPGEGGRSSDYLSPEELAEALAGLPVLRRRAGVHVPLEGGYIELRL